MRKPKPLRPHQQRELQNFRVKLTAMLMEIPEERYPEIKEKIKAILDRSEAEFDERLKRIKTERGGLLRRLEKQTPTC